MSQDSVLLARQPIYDANKRIVAYELLFRDEEQGTPFEGNRATSLVILNALENSDIKAITDHTQAFINFTEHFLFNPPPLEPGYFVLEVLEDVEPNAAVVEQLAALKQAGHVIALDDYIPDPRWDELLKLADIVKLEIPAIAAGERGAIINKLKTYDLRLLAEKVETHEEFEQCRELGCELFQGYFLSKPQIIKGRKLSPDRTAILQLIAAIQSPETSLKELTDIIARDVTLAYKLLRLVNSAGYRRSREITSIQSAISLLGLERIRSWATLLALDKMDDKPAALRTMAMQRARFCELLGQHMAPQDKENFFTVGIMSCIDAYFDQPITDLVNNLPLNSLVLNAIAHRKGRGGLALHTALAFERGTMDRIRWDIIRRFKLEPADVNTLYTEAMIWSNDNSQH